MQNTGGQIYLLAIIILWKAEQWLHLTNIQFLISRSKAQIHSECQVGGRVEQVNIVKTK